VFYLSYLRSELLRRRGRTILTLLGLAIGVALVINISSLSRGLDHAQETALDPLSSIGTDLTITLSPTDPAQAGGFGGRGGGREVLQANQAAITDLSKLGKPGDKFVHDFFLPGTQLTFPQSQAKEIASIPGVAGVSSGLLLSGVHQEGTVPKIVAEIRTGGEELTIRRRITPPTQAEFAQMQACLQKAGVATPRAGGGAPGGGGGGRLGPGQGGARGSGGRFSSAAARACLPERFRELRARITTPEQTLRQVVDPPQTNIESSSYSIGGVDVSKPGIGIVTPSLVSNGRFLEGGTEALLAESYAKRQGLKVGSKLDLNGTKFTVVGLVRPPLGGQTGDVYVPLGRLQKLASQDGLANVVLVRASDSSSVAQVKQAIESRFPNAQVASASEVANQITGSLVDASDLSRRLGIALAVLAAAAAFLLAALLTLSSVGKRVRELGTLKALGWTQRVVVRQVVGESLAQGVAGGLLGVALGVAAAAAIGAFGPTLTASSTTGGGSDAFGLGQITARTVTGDVALTAPIAMNVLLVGFGLALAGGLLAGAAGAFRAARLRPADALRTVE
jgi:ABC-type antimicrobial peptide transport system permease subunit